MNSAWPATRPGCSCREPDWLWFWGWFGLDDDILVDLCVMAPAVFLIISKQSNIDARETLQKNET